MLFSSTDITVDHILSCGGPESGEREKEKEGEGEERNRGEGRAEKRTGREKKTKEENGDPHFEMQKNNKVIQIGLYIYIQTEPIIIILQKYKAAVSTEFTTDFD
jgi:hypothetical protein